MLTEVKTCDQQETLSSLRAEKQQTADKCFLIRKDKEMRRKTYALPMSHI